MKNQTFKKLLSLALAAVMTASLLVGCGSKGEESKEQSSVAQSSEQKESAAASSEVAQSSEQAQEDAFEHDPVLNELGADTICKEKVTITIGVRQNANITDYEDNHYTKMLEEYGNVDIEVVLFPAGSDGNDKLQMMVAGGEELPDIIMWGQTPALAEQWGSEGYIIPLEDYFEHSSYYAKEGYARVKELRGLDVIDYISDANGHVWTFPSYMESTTNPAYNRTWIYRPWLEALNLEVPTTTEEFYEVLKAFKTQDPNGNGKADEIPLIGSTIAKEGFGSGAWEFLMGAFTYTTCRKNFLNSTDGQLSVPYVTEEWKEGVKYIRSLVEENLFDPISFTQEIETFKQVMNMSGDQLVGCFTYGSNSFIKNDHPSKHQWELLPPLTGPDGFCSASYNMEVPVHTAYITEYCEHPEVAFRILDLMTREDFVITSRWGKQGENWDYVADIKDDPAYADMDFTKTWMGYPAYFYNYKDIWNQPNNIHWMNQSIYFRTAEVAAGFYACSLEETQDENGNYINNNNLQLAAKLSLYEEAAPEELISGFKYATTELQTEADLLSAELKEYVYEKLSGWFTGVSDVDADWDAYLAELEAIGLSRYLEIQQAGWK